MCNTDTDRMVAILIWLLLLRDRDLQRRRERDEESESEAADMASSSNTPEVKSYPMSPGMATVVLASIDLLTSTRSEAKKLMGRMEQALAVLEGTHDTAAGGDDKKTFVQIKLAVAMLNQVSQSIVKSRASMVDPLTEIRGNDEHNNVTMTCPRRNVVQECARRCKTRRCNLASPLWPWG